MTKSEKVYAWIFGILAVSAIGWYLHWLDGRDQRLMVWAEAYERCVYAEYHTTPSAWYYEHENKYPECDATAYIADPNLGKSQGSTYTSPSGNTYQLPY